MKTMRAWWLLVALVAVLSACAPPSSDDSMKVAIAKRMITQLDGERDPGRRQALLRDLLQKTETLPTAVEARRSVLFLRAMAALELDDIDAGYSIAKSLREMDAAAAADDAQMEVLAQLELNGWNSEAKPNCRLPDGFTRSKGAKAVGSYWNKIRHTATGAILVLIPAGSFMMGSPNAEAGHRADEQQHQRSIQNPFYLGETEVTQAQWKAVMAGTDKADPSTFKGADLPVEWVTWTDCQEFLKKAGCGLRLPSEAEWEYACRANTKTAYWFGDLIQDGQGTGNYLGPATKAAIWFDCNSWPFNDGYVETAPVGRFQANPWGLHDMHGNVSEWCEDEYAEYPATSTEAPMVRTGAGARVLRGGSWISLPEDCRSAYRLSRSADYRNTNVGFRLARTVPQ